MHHDGPQHVERGGDEDGEGRCRDNTQARNPLCELGIATADGVADLDRHRHHEADREHAENGLKVKTKADGADELLRAPARPCNDADKFHGCPLQKLTTQPGHGQREMRVKARGRESLSA